MLCYSVVWQLSSIHQAFIRQFLTSSLAVIRQLSDSTHACRPGGAGDAGGVPWHPQILVDQLTLYQPGGPIMLLHHYWHPWIFRPSYGPAIIILMLIGGYLI